MLHCNKCEQDYTEETGCLCPVYEHCMRNGLYNSVPPWWIVNEWHEPLYCDDCQSSYMYGNPCKCEGAATVPA